MIRRPPRSTLFPYTNALPIYFAGAGLGLVLALLASDSGFRIPVGGARAITDALLSRLSRSEEHTSELQSRQYLVCRLLLEKKKDREQIVVSLLATASSHCTTA